MRARTAFRLHPARALIALIAIGLALAGCAHTPAQHATNETGADPVLATASPDAAEVWAQNCGRCHNLRPPDEFSYDQWEIIVAHMRVRATLPAEKTRVILEFLKAAR
jgi:hypothetical protein